jgi:hypothetical protein
MSKAKKIGEFDPERIFLRCRGFCGNEFLLLYLATRLAHGGVDRNVGRAVSMISTCILSAVLLKFYRRPLLDLHMHINMMLPQGGTSFGLLRR